MKQWVNAARTVLVVQYDDGSTLTVATRPDSDATWGPPVLVEPDATVDEWARYWARHGGSTS